MFSFSNKIQSQTYKVCKNSEEFTELINMSLELIKKRAAKEQLPVVTAHGVFDNEPCKNEYGKWNGMFLFENDDPNIDPVDLYNNKVKGHEKEWGIAYMEASYRRKTHIWAVCPEGMNIQESQEWMANILGISYDHVCKDKARRMFLTGRVIYRDDELLFAEHPYTAKEEDVACCNATHISSEGNDTDTEISLLQYKATPVKYNTIVQRWLEQNGGEPQVGNRHNTLLKMATELLPTFGLPRQEVEGIFSWVINNCEGGMTTGMQRVLDTLHQQVPTDIDEEPQQECIAILRDEILPFAPELVRNCIMAFEPKYWMAALGAILTACTVYLSDIHFRGCMEGVVVNGEEKRGKQLYAILQSLLVAPSAGGKDDLCRLCEDWAQPCLEDEEMAIAAEEEWRDNGDSSVPRPHVKRQIIGCDATRAALLKCAKDAKGSTMLQISAEMDSWIPDGESEMKKKMATVRKGSNKEKDGSERVGKESVSGMPNIALSFYLAGTEDQLVVMGDTMQVQNGGITRFSVFPLPSTLFTSRPGSVERTEEQMQEIRLITDRLRTLSGYISMPLTQKEIYHWDKQQETMSADSGDELRDLYRRRIADKAIVFAGIYHLLKGEEKESPDVPKLALLYADFMMENMLGYFGNVQMKHIDPQQNLSNRGNKELLPCLPSVFSYDDLKKLRPNLTSSSHRSIVYRWQKSGKVRKEGPKFVKL